MNGTALSATQTALAEAAQRDARIIEGVRRTLILDPLRVTVLRRWRRPRSFRWHLFDEARVRPCGGNLFAPVALDHRWKLTIVNAYKPSISTYLHSRGTDAPIYCDAIELVFDAERDEARAICARIQAWIDTARREYRALRLRQMDLDSPDIARLLSLRACPECGRTLRDQPARGRCRSCGFRYDESMFALRGHLPAFNGWWALASIYVGMAGVVALILSLTTTGAVTLATAVLLLLFGFAMRFGQNSIRRIIASEHDLLILDDPRGSERFDWPELEELRCVQLESGAWRIAGWRRERNSIEYSTLLFCWLASPWGPPEFDLIIDANDQDGRVLCDALIDRWRGRNGKKMETQMHADGHRS